MSRVTSVGIPQTPLTFLDLLRLAEDRNRLVELLWAGVEPAPGGRVVERPPVRRARHFPGWGCMAR